MRKKGKSIFLGFVLIFAAVYLIVSRIFQLPEIGFWSILLTIVLAALIIHGIRDVNFFEILFGIAFLLWHYDELLGIEMLTPWPILGAALLGSIGLSMIFGHKKKVIWIVDEHGQREKRNINYHTEYGQSSCRNQFSSKVEYVKSDNFKGSEIKNEFGTLSVYLDKAVIQTGEAFVDIENRFGSLNLYFPKEWKIVNELSYSFGRCNTYGNYEGSSSNTLYLNGVSEFADVNLYYI